MKVSFHIRGQKKPVSFTAKKRHHKTPKQLKKFLFKSGTKKLRTCLVKARKAWKAWRRSK